MVLIAQTQSPRSSKDLSTLKSAQLYKFTANNTMKESHLYLIRTRKYSRLNARGIPPAVYQVLLHCSVLGGTPSSNHDLGLTWMEVPQGNACPVLTCDLIWMRVLPDIPNPDLGPDLERVYSLSVPHPDIENDLDGLPLRIDLGPVEVLWNGGGYQPPKGCWTSGWKCYGMEMGYPSPGGEQSVNITFRHPSDAGGNYERQS